MKLKQLKEIIDKAYVNARDTNPVVMVSIDGEEAHICRIGQFHLFPDITIDVAWGREKECIHKEQLDDNNP